MSRSLYEHDYLGLHEQKYERVKSKKGESKPVGDGAILPQLSDPNLANAPIEKFHFLKYLLWNRKQKKLQLEKKSELEELRLRRLESNYMIIPVYY